MARAKKKEPGIRFKVIQEGGRWMVARSETAEGESQGWDTVVADFDRENQADEFARMLNDEHKEACGQGVRSKPGGKHGRGKTDRAAECGDE